jgi:hypothetical protein
LVDSSTAGHKRNGNQSSSTSADDDVEEFLHRDMAAKSLFDRTQCLKLDNPSNASGIKAERAGTSL